MLKRLGVGLVAAGLALGVAHAEGKLYSNSFQGKAPPELAGSQWLNAEAPLTLKGLQGQVVYLEFGFLH
jgi:hypothetical protein